MNEAYIEKAATDLLMQIYRDRRYLWPDQDTQPMMMRSPQIAALVCGYDYHVYPTLGDTKFNRHNTGTRIAGLIDRQANKIAVATEFGDKVQLFTGAHEIGHLVLHEDTVMHRDRAFDGGPLQAPRPLAERQADRFAACFLMPQKLLRERFEFMFCCKGQLRFSDVIAFHLDPNHPDRLLYASKDSDERELALARCTQFNNRNLVSLAQQFGVSDSAMAIRIKELDLVRWP
ncbi:ImmA/IrrE family metallo-endopeptidase [Pseudomonas sp. S09G 359]|uniref:ImmA/IrrE family metallo-endopeptidase n=1 Tax=Pseudomonas sp. S09G 359 TaxID=2054919 RepID=UPI000C6DECA9|nr:ImmA/IrrE family metallo-endopeptidase [Pseudomonas sp. S09G 359]AUG07945.1 methenyltetrahydrofolate cyclohydrolase [Pseudomonas sp. S09G 359]